MVRGRRTRAATAVVTNITHSHNSPLLQESTKASAAINEIAQNRIINDDQQCYASPKRKESKIDETAANLNVKTRSNTRCNGINAYLTRSTITNDGASNSNINMAKIKGSQQQQHHHHHHRHHHHHQHNPHQQQEQQHQKISNYFVTVDTKQSYNLSKSENNETHTYNDDIQLYTNGLHKDKQNGIYENDDIIIELEKDDEEENEEEEFSDESNKNDLLNGSMNCSGINMTSKTNKCKDDLSNDQLTTDQFNILKQESDMIKNDQGYYTNSSTSSTSSSSNGSGSGDKNDISTTGATNIMIPSLLKNTETTSKNNIFLQEPVLSLNIDKSPNQPSSIKINKTFEVESVFSAVNSNSNSNSICLNGFNKIVTLKSSPKRSVSSDAETIILNNCNFNSSYLNNNNINNNNKNNIGILLSIDNNSNDSGVIIDQNNVNNHDQQYQIDYNIKNIKQRDELSPSKRRKPTTPHRILCPSPVKLPLVEKCLTTTTSSLDRTPISNKMNTAMHGIVNGAQKRYPKSRRRLNTPQSENSSIALPQLGGVTLTDETLKRINKQQEKLILNSAKNPTAQQNSNYNIIKNNQSKLLNHNSFSRPNTQVLYNTIQNQSTIVNGDTAESKVVNDQMKPPVARPPQQTQKQPKSHVQEITDFYPVRRSVRKTKTAVKEEMMRTLEQAILENREDGLKVKEFDGKGRGVITTRKFLRSEFVVEYIGDLIDMNEANEREYKYSLDENAGCYMYYFKHKNQQYCIDATAESGKLGRLVNHSRNGNLITKVVVIKSKPHLVLIARDDIDAGVELTYDYGDRSKEALQHHPWLAL